MQRNCIFPGRYAPLTYYEDVLEASRNTLMARSEFILFPHPINILLQILSSYVVAKNITCSSYFLYGLMEQKVTVNIHTVHMVLLKLSKSANNTTQ